MRVRIAFLAVVLFAVAILGKMIKIQVVDGKEWNQRAEDIGLQFRTIPATRGNIYSDNGSLLATSVPFYRLAFDPTVAKDEIFNEGLDSLSMLLAGFFGDKTAEDYANRIRGARSGNRQYLVLNRRRIDYQEKKEMSTWPIFRRGKARGGVLFEKLEDRVQPFSYLGRRTVGYMNEDGSGRGLEYSFNAVLAGADGSALFQKMAGGNWKLVRDGSEMQPRHGWDIETTLDINLQDVAESALLKHLDMHEADFGCVVVMEVQTGEIKAISNLTRGDDGKYREVYNYAVQGITEAGSTFKLASMMALFEETRLKLNDTIDAGNGTYQFYGVEMNDAKPGGYGRISVQEAMEKSSNIAVMKLIDAEFGQNPDRLIDYYHALGIAQPLGFQMVGEGIPSIKRPGDEGWSKISHLWMSIGYEVQLAPLHTLALYNAIANDGKLIQPMIVRKAYSANTVYRNYQSAVINDKICSKSTLQKLRTMLEGVVERGTARNINDTYYQIAGKTGTAQKYINGRPSRNYYTSFAGYFPADRPRYSAIVVIDNPKGYQQYGSDVAAPVFKEIADKIYALDIDLHHAQPDSLEGPQGIFPVIRAGNAQDLMAISGTIGLQSELATEEDWVRTQIDGSIVQYIDGKVSSDAVPDVQGMTLRDALYLLENRGMRVEFTGAGRVATQSQAPGTRIVKGSRIKLTLG
ncbi:MAG: penicillin-binding protein [Bacteroidota bacterium]